jgi:hypothetical protein
MTNAFPLRSLAPAAVPAAFPRWDAAFRAVESVLLEMGIDRPHTLRSPVPIERALEDSPALDGALVILDPSELRSAELDLEETVADERGGGSLFLSLPNPAEVAARRVRWRELGNASQTFAFLGADEPRYVGFGRVHFAPRPASIEGLRVLLADTPGFRVALVARALPLGGFVGIWTGDPSLVDELAEGLRAAARAAGHEVPPAAPPLPPLTGIASEADVWRQATRLRGQREVRENELREIARAAALRGVALRRERAAALQHHRKGAA